MIYISFILLIILLSILSFSLSKICNLKLTNGMIFLITFLLYSLFILSLNLVNINILSASKLFWLLLIFIAIGLLFLSLFKYKKRTNLNYILLTMIIVVISFTLMYFSKKFMSSSSLLPLSNVSTGIETALNYINNSIDLNQSNFLVLFFTSFISLLPNSVSLLTITPQIIWVMQIILIYLIIDFFTDLIINTKRNKTNIIIASILCIPFMLGYEVLHFGYTNQVYLLIFTYISFSLLNKEHYYWFIISLIAIPLTFGFNLYSAIYILALALVSLLVEKNNNKFSSILYCVIITLSIISTIVLKNDITANIHNYIYPNQQNLFIPFFSFTSKNIYITVLIIVLLLLSSLNIQRFLRLMAIISIIISSLVLLYNVDFSTKFTLFYLLFNPIILGALFNFEFINSSYYNSLLVGTILLSCYSLTEKNLVNPYYGSSQNYNTQYRIDNSELDIYAFLLNNYSFNERIQIISQAPNTAYFLPNIDLLESWADQMNRCQYCDVNAMNIHEPNELTNIFAYREYGGNILFIEQPKYEMGCDLLANKGIEFIILRKDQTIEINGNWYNLADYFSQCYSIVYSNKEYALLAK